MVLILKSQGRKDLERVNPEILSLKTPDPRVLIKVLPPSHIILNWQNTLWLY